MNGPLFTHMSKLLTVNPFLNGTPFNNYKQAWLMCLIIRIHLKETILESPASGSVYVAINKFRETQSKQICIIFFHLLTAK